MNENFGKFFAKTLIRKSKSCGNANRKHNELMVFSRIPIQTYPSIAEKVHSDAVKRIDAALGLLKLRSSNKQKERDAHD